MKPTKIYEGRSTIRMYNADCMDVMPQIKEKSIDLILADLPYGKTDCDWDNVIDFNLLWGEYQRIIKNNGAIILTATQPFTSELVMSNKSLFKYELIWDKITCSSPALAKIQPLRGHENILVFYKNQPTYNPVFRKNTTKTFGKNHSRKSNVSGNLGDDYLTEVGYPRSILEFIRPNNITKDKGGFHPTQKPIDLFRILIKMYSNKNDVVLDNTMGSGTTLIACYLEKRNAIGIELDTDYFNDAVKRFEQHISQTQLF